ncbi:MAG: AAA family ATPase [Rhizobiales bacterium]|nr:AAA family ATPase [Hyphomicrobiales bacterium]
MKILSLALERYGHFTDRVLDFDPDMPVTVIHGGNEAGKTTALAAVTDVLFGIEERSRFNFLHDYKTMHLGARVAGRDGQTLAFRRLKRRSATLVDPEGGDVLADDCLTPFIGAHDRQAFLEIFGLDQARLREGGRKLLAGGGDLAQTLLAAAPGLSQVAGLRDQLKASAAQIFNPDRKVASHVLYQALDKRDRARAAIRAQELRVEVVRAARTAADEADGARREAVAAEAEARSRLARCQGLAAAAGEIRTIDQLKAERSGLGLLPDLPDGFTSRAHDALEAWDAASGAAALAASEAERATAEAAAISVDDGILALAEAIERADETRPAVAKEVEALPRRHEEASLARGGLARIAAGLGIADIGALIQGLPGPPLLARAGRLIDQLRDLAVRTQALGDERQALTTRRRLTEEAQARLSPAADPAEARRRLNALDGAEERDRSARAQAAALAATGRDLSERLRRLPFAVADGDALAVLPLPALDAATAALRRRNETADLQAREAEALARIDEQVARTEARLATLHAGGTAPTPAAITGARDLRDGLWARLRPLAGGGRAATGEDAETAHNLDAAIVSADRLADERLTETARLVGLSDAELALADLQVSRQLGEQRLAKAKAKAAEADHAWQALWTASRIAPADGEDMLGFLREAGAIIDKRAQSLRAEAEAQAVHTALAVERREVEALRVALGLAPVGEGPLQVADARQAVDAMESRFRAVETHLRDLGRIAAETAALDERDDALRRLAGDLAREAAAVFPPLSIRPEATADEARAALDLWTEAPGLVESLRTAERRITGIDRDRDRFVAEIGDLCGRPGIGGTDADPFVAARTLRARLSAAQQDRSRADQARRAMGQRQQAQAEARQALSGCEAALAPLLAAAGLAGIADLSPLLRQLDAAARIDQALAQASRRLAAAGGGRGEDQLRADLADLDDEALVRQVAEAEAAAETARGARDTAIEGDAAAKARLREVEQATGAAGAAQDEQDALAEIAEAVHRFTRDHVAARLLSSAIDVYRERHQNPIIERASRAFAMLTGDRWTGIGVDYDQEPARLAAQRNGRLHGIEALSEGTADQLFLALRVAAIEEHARRATPLPFVCDDIFISFDEGRTERGLALLGEMGAVTQVLVFTHHEYVVACAERVLGTKVRIVRL